VEALRAHLFAFAIVVAAVLATAGVFVFARPQSHTSVPPVPPNDGLSYTRVVYHPAQAQRAFARAGLRLERASQQPTSPEGAWRLTGMADFHNDDLGLEATVFGPRKLVDRQGFANYYTFVDGKYVPAPRSCGNGARNAERWHENVRVIVQCDTPGAMRTLQRAMRALRR
jgi:hypothetical protein